MGNPVATPGSMPATPTPPRPAEGQPDALPPDEPAPPAPSDDALPPDEPAPSDETDPSSGNAETPSR
jgi:hypothetical protein